MKKFLNLGIIAGLISILLACQPAANSNPPEPAPTPDPEPYSIGISRADGGSLYRYTKAGLLKKSDLLIKVEIEFNNLEDKTSDSDAVVIFYDSNKNELKKLVNPDDSIELVYGTTYYYKKTWKGQFARNDNEFSETFATAIGAVVGASDTSKEANRLIGFNMDFGDINVVDSNWYDKTIYERERKYDTSGKKYYDRTPIYFYIKNNGVWSSKHTEYPTEYVIQSGDESVKYFYGDGDDVNSPEGLECPFTAIELTGNEIIQNNSASLDGSWFSSLRHSQFTVNTEYELKDFSKCNLDNVFVESPVGLKIVRRENGRYENIGLLIVMPTAGTLAEGVQLKVYGPYDCASSEITAYKGDCVDLSSENWKPVEAKPYAIEIEYTKGLKTIKSQITRYNSSGVLNTYAPLVIQFKQETN